MRRHVGILISRFPILGTAGYHTSSVMFVEWINKDSEIIRNPSYTKVFDWQRLIEQSSAETDWCKVWLSSAPQYVQ